MNSVIVQLRRPLIFALLVLLTCVVVVAVGSAEARRVYPQIHIGKLATQLELVSRSMQRSLDGGVPLAHVLGFHTLSRQLVASDEVEDLRVVDNEQRVVLSSVEASKLVDLSHAVEPIGGVARKRTYALTEAPKYYVIRIELSNRVGRVGHLILTAPKSAVTRAIGGSFSAHWWWSVGLAVLVGVGLWFDQVLHTRAGVHSARECDHGTDAEDVSANRSTRSWLPNLANGLAFMTIAALVSVSMMELYTNAVRGRSEALAHSLGARLTTAFASGLELRDFSGLDSLLEEYMYLDPDIGVLALTERVGETETIVLSDARAGRDYPSTGAWADPVDATVVERDLGERRLYLAVPNDVIRNKAMRGLRNLGVLFIASALLSSLLFSLASTASSSGRSDLLEETKWYRRRQLIRPFHACTVLIEGFGASFMPLYLSKIVGDAGLSDTWVQVVFLSYFAANAVMMLPATRWAERYGPRPVMAVGISLAAFGLLGLSLASSFWLVLGMRIFSGIGQSMVYMAVQTYLLADPRPEERPRSVALLVLGLHTGVISGTVIGALLSVYFSQSVVFVLSALIGIVNLGYLLLVVPRGLPESTLPEPLAHARREEASAVGGRLRVFAQVLQVLSEFRFLKVLLFVGIPTRLLATGLLGFVLPLILAARGYDSDEVAQVAISYSLGLLVVTSLGPCLRRLFSEPATTLLVGCLLAGSGLLLASRFESFEPAIILGLFLVGAGHGFIVAPVLVYVQERTRSAVVLGAAAVSSTYRFLERLGHVIGPSLVGMIMLSGAGGPQAAAEGTSQAGLSARFVMLGLVIMGFGLLFVREALPKTLRRGERADVCSSTSS